MDIDLPAREVASEAPGSVTPELLALTPRELSLIAAGPPKPGASNTVSHSRGAALWGWLRDQGPTPTLPDTLTGCGRGAMGRIRQATTLPRFTIDETHVSADGTTKWRLQVGGSRGEGARTIETVLIPTPTRATVCISTQSGCTRFCDFCATARMGYLGAVSAGDMVGQVLLAMRHSTVPLTNVVMMGMGEPLDNLDAVLTTIRVLAEGLRISPRHVTVSTSR
jgi:23S rRNA (adenine2503-C2)-methyltransferase